VPSLILASSTKSIPELELSTEILVTPVVFPKTRTSASVSVSANLVST